MSLREKVDKVRFPVVILFLLGVTLMAGAGTGIVSYANGKEVAGSTHMMMVSHTEYRFQEAGQIIARIVNFQGDPVSVDNCTATILYPDKTFFVNADLMIESANISGDHYYNFTTPNGPEGVYEYQATCTYASGSQERSVTNSFHLSSAFNTIDGNLTDIDNVLAGLDGNITANFSVVIDNQEQILGNFSSQNVLLSAINVTTTNTYDYVTGTLANNVDDILTQLGIINATVNRIETTTGQINTTVTDILANQENEVIMTTFSG